MLQHRNKFIVAFLLILLVAAVDYQLFSEGNGQHVSENIRQIGHFLILLPIALIGSWAWRYQSHGWVAQIWNISYFTFIVLLAIIGGLQWGFDMFPKVAMDKIRLLRLLFCSPLPFLFLAFLIWLIRSEKVSAR